MNFLKKGPELKLSEIKVPGFVKDVYYDLKDRHLLPIAALLVIAIIAVPIALGESSSPESEAEATAPATASQSAGGKASGQLVVSAAPGLRDYRRRLKHLHAKDPFKQQYTGESGSSGSESETESPSSGSGESSGEESTFESTETEHTTVHGELKYYSYAIDVRVTTGGSAPGAEKKSTVRHNLPELTMLPSREKPAIVYMGSTRDGKKALMVVSSDVDAIFGDAKCVLGSSTCEMVAMEPELPETFVYGGAGLTYKIELLKIHLVETNKLNRAPLGKPKQKQNGNSG